MSRHVEQAAEKSPSTDERQCADCKFASECKGRIRKWKNKPAVADTVAVRHVRANRHDGFARRDPLELHTERLARVILCPHCLTAGFGYGVRTRCGRCVGYVHHALPVNCGGLFSKNAVTPSV